jgi:hypothetical protein
MAANGDGLTDFKLYRYTLSCGTAGDTSFMGNYIQTWSRKIFRKIASRPVWLDDRNWNPFGVPIRLWLLSAALQPESAAAFYFAYS